MEIKYFTMKNIALLILLCMTAWFIGCQKPAKLIPQDSSKGILSITATFEDGSGSFTGYSNDSTNKIIIPIPYYFPKSSNNQVTKEQMSNMRLKATLANNVTVNPKLLYMNLNQNNTITVTNQRKKQIKYLVKGKIVKNNQSQIKSFTLPSLGMSGIINEETKTISLISVQNIEPALADLSLSYHATVSPDPRKEKLDYNDEVKLTVTAFNGVNKSVYTVKKAVPGKLPFGIRAGSAKLMFAKKIKQDLGITADHLTGGIAISGDYLVLNTRAENSIYINAKTGEKAGILQLGAVRGNLTNFYSTGDDDGNILICNLSPNAGAFKIWQVPDVDQTPSLLIEWNGGLPVGRKISVIGSIEGDAIITAPIFQSGQRFARWVIKDGALESQTPDIITMSGLDKGWTTNCDIIYSSATEAKSDYFVASYSDNTFAWVDGETNTIKRKLEPLSTNYIQNAVDYISFNNAKYVTANWINSFTWGSSDMVWLLNVSNNAMFTGNLMSGTCPAVVWASERNTYGAKAITPLVANVNGTGDVALSVSDNGYYLYLYFMFTNGYVVGYRFDCIDMST